MAEGCENEECYEAYHELEAENKRLRATLEKAMEMLVQGEYDEGDVYCMIGKALEEE